MYNELIKIANALDDLGLTNFSDQIDEFIVSIAQMTPGKPQITYTFTTAQEPDVVANRWIQQRKMEQQIVSQPKQGIPDEKIQKSITVTSSPTAKEWQGLIVYTLNITKPKNGITNGVLGTYIRTKPTPEQLNYIKTYMTKQLNDLDVTKGNLLSSI